MGSRLSGILATLVMDDLERRTLTADMNISVYSRYVDDIFILTNNSDSANAIFHAFNQQHEEIKFTAEHPSNSASLKLLDFEVTVSDEKISFNYYQKQAKTNMFPHFRSALTKSQATSFIVNEKERVISKCSTNCHKNEAIQQLKKKLKERGYSNDFINSAMEKHTNSRTQNEEEALFFKFPFIDEQTDRRVKNILRKTAPNIHITRRGHNIRSFLSKTKLASCPDNCTIQKCQTTKAVYEYTCGCKENYIGSTKRTLHKRANDHLNPSASQKPSSITTHRRACNNGNFNIKILDRGSDVVDTRIREGLLIRQLTPSLNERDELTAWLGAINISTN